MKLLICMILGHKWRRVVMRHREGHSGGYVKNYPYHMCDRCKVLGKFGEV